MKTELQMINRTEQILEDSDNKIYKAPNIASQLQDSLSELSSHKPQEVRYTKMAVNSAKLSKTQMGVHVGREIDISDIDYININRVEYPIGNYPPTYVDFKVYNDILFIETHTRPSAGQQDNPSGTAQVLTGTVTFSDGSPAVTGLGTAFKSELEVGYYISKSGSSNWYRVSKITDDTHLVLSINCDSDDDGADTSTRYWFEYVYLHCAVNHYLAPTQTDFAGAIDAGVATGYAENTWQIVVDGLGTGVIPKNILLTIADTDGIYRVTEEATIATNEATLKISPRLKGRATEDVVVTFRPSSLTPQLEELLCELTAARVAINGVGDARTAQKNAITAYGLANARIDAMTDIISRLVDGIATAKTAVTASLSTAKTEIGLAKTQVGAAVLACADIKDAVGDYTTAANKAAAEMDLSKTGAAKIDLIEERYLARGGDAEKAIEAANAQIDFAVLAIKKVKDVDDDTDIKSEIDLVNTQLDTAVIDLTTDIDAYNNFITRGGNVVPNLNNKAMGLINASNGYLSSSEALKGQMSHRGVEAEHELRLARVQMQELQSYIRLESTLVTENVAALRAHIATGQGFISIERTITDENALTARSYAQAGLGYVNEGLAYITADARTVSSYGVVLSHEANSAIVDLRQAGGYFNEASMSVRVSQAVYAAAQWGERKYIEVMVRIRGRAKFKVRSATR